MTVIKLPPSRAPFLLSALLNSEVTRPIFTIFLHDVEALLPILIRVFTGQYCIPFQNAREKSEGIQFQHLHKAPKINWLPQQHPLGYHKSYDNLIICINMSSNGRI